MNLRNVIIAILALALPAIAPFQLAAADAEAGKTSYLAKCKTCHGADGSGNAGMAKVLKVEIKHLGDEAVQSKTDDEIKTAITEGSGKMKPVSGLDGETIDNIIAHVRTIKK